MSSSTVTPLQWAIMIFFLIFLILYKSLEDKRRLIQQKRVQLLNNAQDSNQLYSKQQVTDKRDYGYRNNCVSSLLTDYCRSPIDPRQWRQKNLSQYQNDRNQSIPIFAQNSPKQQTIIGRTAITQGCFDNSRMRQSQGSKLSYYDNYQTTGSQDRNQNAFQQQYIDQSFKKTDQYKQEEFYQQEQQSFLDLSQKLREEKINKFYSQNKSNQFNQLEQQQKLQPQSGQFQPQSWYSGTPKRSKII